MKIILTILFILSMGFTAHTQITASYVTAPYGIEQLVMHGDTLIVVGHTGEFYKSYDYGKTFTQFNNLPIEPNGYCFDFQIINNTFYYATRNGFPSLNFKIYKSINNGTTWQTVFEKNIIATDFLMVDSAFGLVLDETFDTAWVATGSDTIWHWHHLNTFAGGNCLSVKNNDSTVTTFRSTSTYQTADRGGTWQKINNGNNIETLLNGQCINEDTIYFVGYDGGTEYDGRFLYSYDGGNTIIKNEPGDNIPWDDYNVLPNDIFFINSKFGFIFGSVLIFDNNGFTKDTTNIIYTQDFGQTFEPLYTGYTEKIYRVTKANDSILVMGGENGIILRWNMNQPLGYLNLKEQVVPQKSINFYPNPIKHSASIKLQPQQLPAQFKLFNSFGQMVFKHIITTTNYTFHRNQLPQGIYFFSINGVKGKMVLE